MARTRGSLYSRFVGAMSAYNVGKALGRHVDRNGFQLDDDIRAELTKVWGREGRYAFALGFVAFGWAALKHREILLVFLLGALLGWRAWEKLLEAVGVQRALPSANGAARPAVDTVATSF